MRTEVGSEVVSKSRVRRRALRKIRYEYKTETFPPLRSLVRLEFRMMDCGIKIPRMW